MTRKRLLECAFLIPLRRDKNLSDGKAHKQPVWDWLEGELWPFGGATCAKYAQIGWYVDPDTRKQVWDDSWRYTVAIPREHVALLRKILGEACHQFAQKCIYLSVAGYVEFVARSRHEKQ